MGKPSKTQLNAACKKPAEGYEQGAQKQKGRDINDHANTNQKTVNNIRESRLQNKETGKG